MKRSLGSLLLILCSSLLFSEDFSYKFTVDKPHPYLKEAVILTLEIEQTNHDKVLFFNFDLKKSTAYTFQRVGIKEEGKNHFAYREYRYLVYPLKEGEVHLNFKLKKRVTTDDSILYSYSGDRDNVKGLVTVESDISLPPVSLTVKSLPKETELVGDFTLNYHLKTHHAKAYQAIPIQLEIKGQGYPPLLTHLLISESNISIFKEKPLIHSHATLEGTENTIQYSMAISNRKSFSLKERTIKAFSPKRQQSYLLTLPKQEFIIESVEPKSLVDKEEYPKSIKSDFSWLSHFFSYFIIFITGYLTAMVMEWKRAFKPKEKSPFYQRVERCQEERELLQLLIANNPSRFKAEIEALENALYGRRDKIDLKKIKEQLLKEIA